MAQENGSINTKINLIVLLRVFTEKGKSKMTNKEARQILLDYIKPNGVGFPDVKEAIKLLLEQINEIEQIIKTKWTLPETSYEVCTEIKGVTQNEKDSM